MSKKMQRHLKDWIEWIKLERRLSKQTIKAYTSDVKFFFKHFEEYKNKSIDLSDLENLGQLDLTSWFYKIIKNGVGLSLIHISEPTRQ